MTGRLVPGAALLSAFLAAGVSMPVSQALAHHSFALFDTQKTVSLNGTVKKFEWSNPHSWIFLDVADETANAGQWTIELPAAAILAGEGWNKNYLKTGDRISVMINPLKNGMKGGSLESFTPKGQATEQE